VKAPTFDAVKFLGRYDRLDKALVAVGFPPTSPWWRKQLDRFLRAGRRRWVIRAGRRAGKSSTLCRLAVAVALWGSWSVPPGDVAVIPFVSVDRDEASARLRTIAEILKVLSVRFEQRNDEIELPEKRLVFRVVSCTVRGTVGFTSVAVFADEMAKWESRETAANPAQEVMGSLRPTMATQPSAFEVCSSSPWGTDDYHAELFDAGDTAHQVASFAPTWEANPTITEEQTHELEPDERVWSREYAAVPGATLSAAFDPADIAAAFAKGPTPPLYGGFVTIDASSLRGDAFAYMCGREMGDDGGFSIEEIGGWEDEQLRGLSMSTVCDKLKERARKWGTSRIFGDQREEAALRALFNERGIRLMSYAWNETSKDAAVTLLRRLFRERQVSLCEHPRLRRELIGMKARLMPSGRTSYATNGLDYASCLITLAHGAVERDVLRGERGKMPGLMIIERTARNYVIDDDYDDLPSIRRVGPDQYAWDDNPNLRKVGPGQWALDDDKGKEPS
jgi:hypothetical protein